MSANLLITGPHPASTGELSALLATHPGVESAAPQIISVLNGKNGLNDLHRSLQKSYHVNRMSKKIREFRAHARLYLSVEELSELETFLDHITAVEYEGMPFCDRSELTPVKTIRFERLRRKAKKYKRKPKMGSMYIPVGMPDFQIIAKDFIELLISRRQEKKDSVRALAMSTAFPAVQFNSLLLNNPLVVCLNHDPRNLYARFKKRGDDWLGTDAARYCRWFAMNMQLLERESEGEKSILFIQHEHLLTDTKSAIKSVFEKLNINPGLMPSELFGTYKGQDPEMYKTVCSDDELKIIEKECMNWIEQANEAMKTGVWHA
jgi:hypothetical protein